MLLPLLVFSSGLSEYHIILRHTAHLNIYWNLGSVLDQRCHLVFVSPTRHPRIPGMSRLHAIFPHLIPSLSLLQSHCCDWTTHTCRPVLPFFTHSGLSVGDGFTASLNVNLHLLQRYRLSPVRCHLCQRYFSSICPTEHPFKSGRLMEISAALQPPLRHLHKKYRFSPADQTGVCSFVPDAGNH